LRLPGPALLARLNYFDSRTLLVIGLDFAPSGARKFLDFRVGPVLIQLPRAGTLGVRLVWGGLVFCINVPVNFLIHDCTLSDSILLEFGSLRKLY
jgi:hypothetical protein